jgi:hypothetical protein
MWPDLITFPAYLLVSQYGQFQRFSIPITKSNSASKKTHLFVCLHPFAFPHHSCPVTAHTVLYVTLLSNNLSTTLVFGPKAPKHFTVSARTSPNNCTDKLSVQFLCLIFSPLTVAAAVVIRQLHGLYLYHKKQSNCTAHCPVPVAPEFSFKF